MKTGLHRMAALAAFFSLAAGSAGAQQKLTEFKFGTNWVAQAEHGGYYQAIADGTYEKYGLKVTIVPGGPQANNRMLLPVGRIDFYMGGNMVQALSAVEENIPTLVVAAHFQKDPQILMSHPGQGYGHVSGPQEVERHPAREGRCRHLLPVDESRVRLQGGADEALHLQPGSVPRQQEGGAAGLRHVRAPCGREGRRLQAEHLPSRRQWLHAPTRRPWRRGANSSRRARTSCSASSMPRRSAGTTISTATTRRRTRSSRRTTPR